MTHILRSRAITVSVKQKAEQKADSPKLNHLQVEQHAKPLRLVYCDEDGTFRMDAEAVATLQLVKGPLGVVSVCGRARQGKSFILNQLLGRSSGFQVAATHRPCTKGLWMWSTPLKRIAPDGTEYSLVLLDSEGIDAYDQTGTYSTQIFSMAVLLSSMFVYNQMGGIDEAALDRLSLVTEMTKHIRVRTSDHRPSAAELGQFSPIFLWLLRDFYLDLTEDGRRISPRDYLEGALQPLSGVGKAIAARNEIRDSIRALFPDRDCFTLVRPLNDERDLQRLDQIPLDRLRPEFRAGLDSLTKFIFERTKPKQLGSIIMTGPLLASLTQSFLDAINAGAVPTIATSWQNVEESECRRAHDSAMEKYIRIVDESQPTDEEKLREIHESAVEDALRNYNSEAVGAGAARQKYEKLLLATVRRHFEENIHKLGMEAEMRCVKAVESMDEKLWEVCQSSSATFDEALEMLNSLVIDYEHTTYGPAKWKKLAKFLQSSLEGPLSDMTNRLKSQSLAENSVLQLKCQSLEERLANTRKQLEASKRDEQDWKKRYESAVADSKVSEDAAATRYAALQKMHNALEAKFTALSLELEAYGKETLDWRSKYEHLLSDENAVEKRMTLEIEALQSRCSAAEGRLAATREQLESAKEEAAEWKRKHDSVMEECRTTSEKYSAMCDRISAQAVSRQDALREEFSTTIALKEKELKDSESKLEEDERNLAALQMKLEDQILKHDVQEQELSLLTSELKQAKALADAAKAAALSSEKELRVLKQECSHLEERFNVETKRLEEVEAKYRSAQQEAKLAVERAEKARDEASQAEKDKLEANRLAAERLAAQERSDRRAETLAREKEELLQDLKRLRLLEEDSEMRMKSIDRQLEDREREMEELLDSAHKQRANTIQVLETLLASERRACADANARAEALSLQLQATQSQLDSLQREFSTTRLNETVLDSKLRTCQGHHSSGKATPLGKRLRDDNGEPLQEIQVDDADGAMKKRACILIDDTGNRADGGEDNRGNAGKPDSSSTSNEANEDEYLKFTVPKLRQELTNAGFAEELLQLRSAAKKDIISLYERLILHK